MSRSTADPDDTFTCPNCGEQVPGGAPCCPECGSDDQTGWSQDTMYDDLDLPGHEQAFDDEEIVPGQVPNRAAGSHSRLFSAVFVSIIVLLLIVALLKCFL